MFVVTHLTHTNKNLQVTMGLYEGETALYFMVILGNDGIDMIEWMIRNEVR